MKEEHIRRICVGLIENVYADVGRVHVRVINSVQYPDYNAVSWSQEATLDYDEIVQYTQTKWEEIIAVVARIRENQALLDTLLQPHYKQEGEKDKRRS